MLAQPSKQAGRETKHTGPPHPLPPTLTHTPQIVREVLLSARLPP